MVRWGRFEMSSPSSRGIIGWHILNGVGVDRRRAMGYLCRVLWVKPFGVGYRNEWQCLRGHSLGPARRQGNAAGPALWNLLAGSAWDRGVGSVGSAVDLWPSSTPHLCPTPPGPVDDVLDYLCTLHGSGDLHRHLCFLVWAQGVWGLWAGDG